MMGALRSGPALRALVATDLKLFLRDRRSVILNLITPLVIAGLFGMVFGGGGGKSAPGQLPIAVVDLDGSAISTAVVAGLTADATLDVALLDEVTAREQVRKGRIRAAVILPPEFGERAGRSLLRAGEKPRIDVLHDPSQPYTMPMVQGLLTQQVFNAVTRELFGGDGGRRLIDEAVAELDRQGADSGVTEDLRELLSRARSLNERSRPGDPVRGTGGGAGLSIPFDLGDQPVTSGRTPYNGYAHATAGMGVQFILMMGIEAGVGLLMLRRRGLWLRLKAAPLSRATLLTARVVSAAIMSLLMLAVLYGGAALLFGVRVDGSIAGFVGIAIAFSLTTAAFGLLVAALGETPEATRGIAIFATLVMVLLGGGWVPSFLFPAWLQQASLVLPTSWAIRGLEAMTWRGLGMDEAWPAIAALCTFAAAFLAIAVWRFRWDAGRN
jgi:ABC-2 type transport system permease protein